MHEFGAVHRSVHEYFTYIISLNCITQGNRYLSSYCTEEGTENVERFR